MSASCMAMPKIEMNPMAAETEKSVSGDQQRQHAARAGDGHAERAR